MLNPDQKLNNKIFEADIELKSMRAGFGEGLVIAGQMDKQVIALSADLTESTGLQAFRNKFPERFIEVGIAEQNLVTVASGMAVMGKIPFIASYAVFSPGRNWEQIRTTICYNNVPVKIIGTHAGVNAGPDGGSHQALEDIAMMRSLPRMVVISPCDAIEAMKAVIATAKTKDPTYIRLPREKSPVITTEDTPFKIGKAQIASRPHLEASPRGEASVGIIATGPLLYHALVAAKKLEEEGKKVIVMNLSTIKPLDTDAIISLAHETRGIVTVEEHQIAGGMGSAVAECLAAHFPVPIEFVGVKDQFGQSGQADELIEHYEMGESHIRKAVERVMLRK
ncbi:MAG: transketolase C-terminal domain-containing protein [Candidatus Paceibacterota bacterium]|jgi:transketolase